MGENTHGNTMPHLVIIDGLSFFFRAYHALPPLTRKSDGLPTNALHGFAQMLLRVINDLKPDLCAVALDSKGPTFRDKIYDAYKANRGEMDAEMVQQMPYFEPLIRAFGVEAIQVEGVEADDIIATYAELSVEKGYRLTIVSSDKDLYQLITPTINLLDTMKNKRVGIEQVIEKFGVLPEKVTEVQALIGDTSDNIPGVPGIGPKTAATLIEKYGTLEGIYEHIDDISRPKLRENLITYKDNAFLSRTLVTLKRDVPLPEENIDLNFDPDVSSAISFLEEMEFSSLTTRLKRQYGEEGSTVAVKNTPGAVATPSLPAHQQNVTHIKKVKTADNTEKTKAEAKYVCVTTKAQWREWLAGCKAAKVVAFDTETTNIHAARAALVGISLACEEGYACYVPLAHKSAHNGELDFTNDAPMQQLHFNDIAQDIADLLADKNILKVGHNIKYDLQIMHNVGVNITPIADTMLQSFVLDGGKHNHGLDTLAKLHLKHNTIAFKDVAGTGAKQVTFDYVPLNAATQYAAEDADITLKLYNIFTPRLNSADAAKLLHLYKHVELPLVPTLAAMEMTGVCVDKAELLRLSQEFATRLAAHEEKIFNLAGCNFNVNSPKQLGEVLFDKMGIPLGKNKKRSTNVEVLEKLEEDGHAIAREILAYRSLAKLRSTYTEALLQQINPKTWRIHTSYNQTGAATGRFSSSDPNLQNIPIRTEDGRKIRRAFIPQDGWDMLAADYSQIELRLLAHFSESKALMQAFADDIDIHTHTAHQIFNIPYAEVTPDKRRVAKIINFGIVYGMGAASLAKQTGATKSEAAEYIENYFTRYSGVRDYMAFNKDFARTHGYVETLMGRRVHLPDIMSGHGGLRAGAERAAINAPLQGSNADIIKKVMPEVDTIIKQNNLKTNMLLQVHDELVFEVPPEEHAPALKHITSTMENVVKLRVPLKVEADFGRNWEEAH